MIRSDARILTTHTGSLPRPAALTQMFLALSKREDVDREAMRRQVEAATLDVIRKQREAGIDVGNNGEQPHESFFTYVQHRMSGFGGQSARPMMQDIAAYASFITLKLPHYSRTMVSLISAPKAIGAGSSVNLKLR